MRTFLLIAAIAVMAVMGGCKDGDDDDGGKDEPKTQTATLTGLFDNNASATVTGYFTNAEWEGVPNKIKTAINTAFTGLPTDTAKNNYKTLFSTGVTITVEKTTDYENWKTNGNGKTISLNYNSLNKADLSTLIGLAIRSIGTSGTEQG